MIANKIQSALKVGLGIAAFAATAPVHAQDAEGLEEVFVTARKRDEGVQAVPISIAALSAETLSDRNVSELQDMNVVVPGFRLGSEGGKGNTNIIMRGLSKIPLGEGIPSVVTYFANVALPARGGNIPAYDIANIQVLKGPQGTLFGRNTLGGAVVIAPEAPGYELGGYIKGNYGTKDYRSLEGALNVPVVEDKVALRVAGQIRRGDGMNKNLSGGPDFDNTHQNSYRISLLLNPTDDIESTTVYDHFEADEVGAAGYLFRTNEPTISIFDGLFAARGLVGLKDQIEDYAAGQKRAGYHAAYTDIPDGGYVKRKLWGISNDTSWDTGSFTVRNIAGYRRVSVSEKISTGSTGPIELTSTGAIPGLPAGTPVPFVLFNASQDVAREYLSDEFQIFGNALDDRLDWIVGAFYNKDNSTDPNGSLFTAFSPFARPAPAVTSNVENRNKALFAQVGYDLSDWVVDGLKLNLGIRKSWDDVSACGGSLIDGGSEYLSDKQCEAVANTGAIDGVAKAKNSGNEWSWTWGADWQINPDTLVYFTSRHGYRGVNINTPVFETPWTTGAVPAVIDTYLAANPQYAAVFAASGTSPYCSDPLGAAITCPDLRPFQKTDPEKLTDYEVGAKNDWAIGDVKGRANVAAFWSSYKNAVQFINTQTLGIPQITPDSPSSGSVGINAADLTIYGLEADVTVVPIPSLTITLSGAYTKQEIDKVSNPVPGLTLSENEITLPSPEFAGTLGFNWVLPVAPLDGELALNGDYYHTEKFSGQGGENLPAYEVANFRLNWKDIAKSGLDMAVYVKNAFDEEYFSSPVVLLKSFPMSVVNVGERRTWGVEAAYKF